MDTYTLDQLIDRLEMLMGPRFEIIQHELPDGSSFAIACQGRPYIGFRGRLASSPPVDDVTPRGPKVYYDMRFLHEPHG